MVGGDTAVQAFYIISGFYMALILTRKYPNSSTFFRNRFLRLFPMYWLVLASTCAWSLILLVAGREGGYPGLGALVRAGRSMPPVGWFYLLFSNVFILGQDLSLYLHLSGDQLALTADFQRTTMPLYLFQLVPRAWSISMELIFYMLAPLLVRCRVVWLIALVAASVGVRVWLFAAGLDHDPWLYRFLPAEFGLFVLGVLVYRVSVRQWPAVPSSTARWQVAGLLLFAVLFGSLPHPVIKRVVFCLFTAASVPALFALTKDSPFDRYIGELSYPIYLSHLLLIEVVARFRLGAIGNRWAAILTTLACSAVLYELVQKRVDRARNARLAVAGEQTFIP
jgi:peptidoglycan/LPS O-acetylase OafA/YrhL